jgi:hypothetical protein
MSLRRLGAAGDARKHRHFGEQTRARQDGRRYGASRLPQGKFEQGAGSFDKTARLGRIGLD